MLNRIKVEYDRLVDDMLDRLPRWVWTSTDTTFCDLSIGGGQIVRKIEARLREAGHSDDNIRRRVFGFEENDIKIRYAVNRYELVGQYSCMSHDKLFKGGVKMKFDVVVGNPPYNGETKNHTRKPWIDFVKLSLSLQPRHILLITPTSWAYGESRMMESIRKEMSFGLIWADLGASRYFPEVGDDISVWHWIRPEDASLEATTVITKDGKIEYHSFEGSRFLSEEGHFFKNIKDKVYQTDDPRLPLKKSQIKGDPLTQYQYRIQYSASQVRFTDQEPEDYFSPKVFINRSGHYWTSKNPNKYIHFMKEGVAGDLAFHILVKDETQGKRLVNILQSKLFVFLMQFDPTKNSQFKDDIGKLPLLDLKKVWRDEDIYQCFNLTPEEIAYIEEKVK